MDNIGIPAVQGKYEQQVSEGEYEPTTERESDVVELDAEDDDDPTPRKKQKTVKKTVREAVGSSRQEPELR